MAFSAAGLAAGRNENSEQPTSPLRQPRPKRVAEEVELDDRMLGLAIGVLAVDQFGLLRMEHQSVFAEPAVQHVTQSHGLALGAAMADDVVGIPLKRHPGKPPPWPDIEHVVQKQVGQERSNYPSLRRPPVPRNKVAIFHHHGPRQPAFDVEQYPGASRVLAHRPQEQVVVDAVEETLDVDVDDPVIPPAPLTGRPDRIDRLASGPIPI